MLSSIAKFKASSSTYVVVVLFLQEFLNTIKNPSIVISVTKCNFGNLDKVDK
jgi:hypothetical protein